MSLLKGKNILIVGVANKHSIASGIADSMAKHGANLAFTYQNDRFKQKVEKLAEEWGSKACFPCDVSKDEEIEQVFKKLKKDWDGLDCIVHAVGLLLQMNLTEILLMSQPEMVLKLRMI